MLQTLFEAITPCAKTLYEKWRCRIAAGGVSRRQTFFQCFKLCLKLSYHTRKANLCEKWRCRFAAGGVSRRQAFFQCFKLCLKLLYHIPPPFGTSLTNSTRKRRGTRRSLAAARPKISLYIFILKCINHIPLFQLSARIKHRKPHDCQHARHHTEQGKPRHLKGNIKAPPKRQLEQNGKPYSSVFRA